MSKLTVFMLAVLVFGLSFLFSCAGCGGDDDDDDSADDDTSDDDDTDDDDSDDDADDDVAGDVEWKTAIIDSTSASNRVSQLYVDDSGNVHIAYTGCNKGDCSIGALYYAFKPAGSDEWFKSVVDDTRDVGWFTPIYVDGSVTVHIFYHDHVSKDVKYARGTPGSWQFQLVDKAGDVGWWITMWHDSANKFHLIYRDCCYDMNIKYAYGDASGWTVNYLITEGDTGEKPAIVQDSTGKFHISFADWCGALRYASGNWGSWTQEYIDTSGFSGTSIDVDSSNTPHIAYGNYMCGEDNSELWHAYKTEKGWQKEKLDGGEEGNDAGYYASLVIDDFDGLHIAYAEWANHIIKYARKVSSEWEFYDVDAGRYVYMAPDKFGGLHMVYEAMTVIAYAYCEKCMMQ